MNRVIRLFAIAIPVWFGGVTAFAGTGRDSHADLFQQGASEGRLIKEIRHELRLLPYYGVFDHLAFSVNDGSVGLVGAVARPTLKSEAENVVKRIEGVTVVRNEIEVLPLSPIDDQIRLASYRAIYRDSALVTRYGYWVQPPIHIVVRNGDVTLEGVVANDFDRNIVNVRANTVPNVFSVTNNLRVDAQNN